MLVGEGLAVRVPNKGTAVRTTDPHAIQDVSPGPHRARGGRRVALAGRDRGPARRRCARRWPGTGSLVEGEPTNAELNEAHLAIHLRLRRADRVRAAGGDGRRAQRRDPARARHGRPQPAQRARPGALPRRPGPAARGGPDRGRRDRARRTTSRAPSGRCWARSGSTSEPSARHYADAMRFVVWILVNVARPRRGGLAVRRDHVTGADRGERVAHAGDRRGHLRGDHSFVKPVVSSSRCRSSC